MCSPFSASSAETETGFSSWMAGLSGDYCVTKQRPADFWFSCKVNGWIVITSFIPCNMYIVKNKKKTLHGFLQDFKRTDGQSQPYKCIWQGKPGLTLRLRWTQMSALMSLGQMDKTCKEKKKQKQGLYLLRTWISLPVWKIKYKCSIFGVPQGSILVPFSFEI